VLPYEKILPWQSATPKWRYDALAFDGACDFVVGSEEQWIVSFEATLELEQDPVPRFCVRSDVCFPDLDSVVALRVGTQRRAGFRSISAIRRSDRSLGFRA
jgi:hypothetical protein